MLSTIRIKQENCAGNVNASKLVLSDPKRPEEAAHQETQPVQSLLM